MIDLFDQKNIQPMLVGEERREPFESPDFIYELKLDGLRCIAYVDTTGTELRNKRNIRLLPGFPELSDIHRAVAGRCILDGELLVMSDGKPDFEILQGRSLATKPSKIQLAMQKHPASFVAYDILYRDGKDLTGLPLMERKQILSESVSDGDHIAISRVIPQGGIALFKLTKDQGLEGIVAKRRESKYMQGKRTKDWIKIKNLVDEDFLALGYIEKENGFISLVLAKNENGEVQYHGHVTLGVSRSAVEQVPIRDDCPFPTLLNENEDAIWFGPPQICTVTYMERTSSGGMRAPRLKRFGNLD